MAMALAIFNEYAGVLSNVNACREFFSWTASVITATRSSRNTSELSDEDKTAAHQQTEEEIERLKDDLWKLETTMPKMLDLIDRVEYQSHKKQAADLLPHIKDAVFEAEDLLDELDYDALKWKVECSKNLGLDQLRDTCLEFYDSVRSNDYIRKVNRIQKNLDHVHKQSMEMGLHQAPLKFDKSVRPETTSYFNCEEKMIGREKEMKEL
ncbi:uncharacterized protein, partial [Triticum aestivum]|uniref:uncharacterized protein n=1 Tax=Triticum aestivum TaxID=4565 RepID=UPI001D015286